MWEKSWAGYKKSYSEEQVVNLKLFLMFWVLMFHLAVKTTCPLDYDWPMILAGSHPRWWFSCWLNPNSFWHPSVVFIGGVQLPACTAYSGLQPHELKKNIAKLYNQQAESKRIINYKIYGLSSRKIISYSQVDPS